MNFVSLQKPAGSHGNLCNHIVNKATWDWFAIEWNESNVTRIK